MTVCNCRKSAVDWILANLPNIKSRSHAVKLGQIMMNSYLLHHVTSNEPFRDKEKELYRFQVDDESASKVLNRRKIWKEQTQDVHTVCNTLHSIMKALLTEFSIDGKLIDLDSLSNSSIFRHYLMESAQLQKINLNPLNRDEKIAFFINAYNLLVMHASIVQGTPNNVFKRLQFFAGPAYDIEGWHYSLNDIEHGILRGNKAPLFSLRNEVFSKKDGPIIHCIKPMDARIHFALNCGVMGCPQLRSYVADELDEQLNVAGMMFCRDNVQVNTNTRIITLSKIFEWYNTDFGDSEVEMLEYVLQFLEGKQAEDLLQVLRQGNFKVVFLEYDWETIFVRESK
eukprot:TRINITY_DN147_c2_g1_i1.p1 TRINITY_DN147_c2_g1~~TRINITY_DN147_c2_g1_i1.p1  ORF type:complete len:340 (-),score=113.48 TRINITY_DN147_c2_g1_i1:240-1259(-)